MIWPIDNTTAHHHTFLIVQSDLDDLLDNGLPFTLISQHDLFIVFLEQFVIVQRDQISTNMVHAPVRAPPILVYIGRPYVPCLLLRFDINLDCNNHPVFWFLIGETP